MVVEHHDVHGGPRRITGSTAAAGAGHIFVTESLMAQGAGQLRGQLIHELGRCQFRINRHAHRHDVGEHSAGASHRGRRPA